MTQSSNDVPALHPLLRERWSPRAFQDRPVEPEKIESILEAARWAPSAMNEQPWRFLIGVRETHPAAYDRLFQILLPGNQLWAGQAPVLMLSVAKMRNSKDQPNPHAFHDVGQAVAHLTVQAMALGLHVHQMAGFDAAKARESLSIPEGYDPVAAIAVGYQGDPNSLPENLRERELAARVRRPLSEIVFDGQWGEAAEAAEPGS
jgi:nitroreductase